MPNFVIARWESPIWGLRDLERIQAPDAQDAVEQMASRHPEWPDGTVCEVWPRGQLTAKAEIAIRRDQ